MVLQVITIAPERFEHYRRNPDFIQRHIFPGGMLPTQAALARQIGAAGRARLSPISLGFGVKLVSYGDSSATNGRETQTPADRNQ